MAKSDDIFSDSVSRLSMNITYLVDSSGSMVNEPINQLNVAMAEAVQVAEDASRAKEVVPQMRVIEFNTTAHWLIGDAEHGVEHIDWIPLTANGGTDTAGAVRLAKDVMHTKILGTRNCKPVVIMITDADSNNRADTQAAIQELRSSLVSSTGANKDKIIRIAIGVNGANQEQLHDFASVGTIIKADGTELKNHPLVFSVDDISLLESLLRGVTASSIASATQGAAMGDDDEEVIITEVAPSTDASDDAAWVD